MAVKKAKFHSIFQSGLLGPLQAKNRLIMAPMGTRLASENGAVTYPMIEYYEERAKGGVGTIVVECTAVDYPQGAGSPKNLTFHHNAYIAGHNDLVEAIHRHGAIAISQIYHVGRNAKPANLQGKQPVAPSPIACPFINVVPRELPTGEVEEIVQKFVDTAVRARTAGYDGVELHGAHGYLIGSFMSASSNLRQDRYGGNLERRMTFAIEIIQGIRRQLGKEYPILFRLSGDEFVPGGMGLEETKRAVQFLEEAGISAIDVSAGTYDSMTASVEPMAYPQGWKIYLAEAIKKVVRIPVIGVGVIRTPEFAERLLQEGKVDFIELGRALLADPEWPAKAKSGREKEIVPCISCNDGCLGGRIFKDLSIRCAVNPRTGREYRRDQAGPVRIKKVFIIGGGPAGMVAALTAKKRGFRVRLYEKSNRLGGQLWFAAAPSTKEKIGWYRDYLVNQIEKEKIEVRLKDSANPKTILREMPDAVILATGARPFIPDIPGIESKCVATAWEVLGGRKKFGDKVVLVAGGGSVGCETALHLLPKNKKVMIAEMLSSVALDVEPVNRMDLISRIEKSGIEVLLGRKIIGIEEDEVVLSDLESREERVRADCVVLALGATPENGLADQIGNKISEVYAAGDCHSPRKIMDAVYEGYIAASRL